MRFTLAQANKEARACGMTYGKWEALRHEGDYATMRGFGMTLEQIARYTNHPKHIEMARAAGIEIAEPKRQKARRGREGRSQA